MKIAAHHEDNRAPLEKARDHLEEAKKELHECDDESTRYVCMTLVWCIESVIDLLELHSVS